MNEQPFHRQGRDIVTQRGEVEAQAATPIAAQRIVNSLNFLATLRASNDPHLLRLLHELELQRARAASSQPTVGSAEMRERMAARGVDVSGLPPVVTKENIKREAV